MGNKKSKLEDAIYLNSVQHVEDILSEYPEILNEFFDSYRTSNPLIKAASLNRIEIIKIILSKNPNLNIKTKSGESALGRAAKFNNLKILEFLILNGADINTEDNCGWTPFDFAITNGNFFCAKILKEKGSKIKMLNFYKNNIKRVGDKEVDMERILGILEGIIEENLDENERKTGRILKNVKKEEMVFDPNETYPDMIYSLIHFENPKMIPRKEIKSDEQFPENRRFQKIKQILNWRNTNYLETTKQSQKKIIKNEKERNFEEAEKQNIISEMKDIENQEELKEDKTQADNTI